MNKQELIDYCNAIKENKSQIINCIDVNRIIKKIEQLDESQKVKVPQFVANYIDISKFYVRTLHYALENSPEKVNLWLCENEINRQNTFARAWLDGYEIEKEKRYRISMPKARNHKNHAQILCEKDGSIFWCGEWYRFRTKFTRKQLEEAGFGWVFSCEGIEIEEVE
nr:MAG TPA: Protein of unknown function (DUF1642) [Siphoviridae sp. ctuHV12]